MPFWSTRSNTWANAAIEPKRPYKFIVPIPIIMPKEGSPASTKWFSESFTSDGAISRLNRWDGVDNLVEFPVLSCTKPGFKTEAYRTTNGAGGFARKRQNQPSVYTFDPIIIEIVDTVSHDLESTITALLYARGLLKESAQIINNPDAGRLISFGNMVEVVKGSGCGTTRVQTNLDIYETNASTAFRAHNPGQPFSTGDTFPKVRTLRLNNSCIVGAEFGMLDHRGEQLSTVRLTIDYDSYDYKISPLPHDEDLPSRNAVRRSRTAVKQFRKTLKRANRMGGP